MMCTHTYSYPDFDTHERPVLDVCAAMDVFLDGEMQASSLSRIPMSAYSLWCSNQAVYGMRYL